MKRVVMPELLDEDLGTAEEIRSSLLDLRGINQHFGGFAGMAALLRLVAHKTGKRSFTFLDIAGGTGDVALHVTQELGKDAVQLRATVLDRAVSHMNGSGSSLRIVAGDALAVPFSARSFDVVGCNLFCHHIEPDRLAGFFEEALRVARIAVIASDLRRNLFHWLAAYAGGVTYRSRITRHDAPVSVRRAYTIDEIRAIAAQTSAARFEVRPHFFQRFGLILWKEQL